MRNVGCLTGLALLMLGSACGGLPEEATGESQAAATVTAVRRLPPLIKFRRWGSRPFFPRNARSALTVITEAPADAQTVGEERHLRAFGVDASHRTVVFHIDLLLGERSDFTNQLGREYEAASSDPTGMGSLGWSINGTPPPKIPHVGPSGDGLWIDRLLAMGAEQQASIDRFAAPSGGQ